METMEEMARRAAVANARRRMLEADRAVALAAVEEAERQLEAARRAFADADAAMLKAMKG